MLNGFHKMSVSEYDALLDGLKRLLAECEEFMDGLRRDDAEKQSALRNRLLGYITANAGTGSERLYTETQLKEIFSLLDN